jgi:cytochrome c oxidase assembly protein subunit 15
VVQAVLGGLTVLMLLPLPLAVAHAATAQAFFCLMIAMVLFSSPGFGSGSARSELPLKPSRPSLTVLATATTTVVYVQILVGALIRHLGAGLAIPDFPASYGRLVPPFYSLAVDINFAHRCGAIVALLLISWTFERVIRFYSAVRPIRNGAILMLGLVALQITLGALTVWSGRAVLPTTSHVAIGAAVLGASLALTIRAYELNASSSAVNIVPSTSRIELLARQVSA